MEPSSEKWMSSPLGKAMAQISTNQQWILLDNSLVMRVNKKLPELSKTDYSTLLAFLKAVDEDTKREYGIWT